MKRKPSKASYVLYQWRQAKFGVDDAQLYKQCVANQDTLGWTNKIEWNGDEG